MENDNYEYGHQSLSNCPGTPPESYMPCNLGPCPPPQEWRVGIWGVVSESMVLMLSSHLSVFCQDGQACLQSHYPKITMKPNEKKTDMSKSDWKVNKYKLSRSS